MINACRYQIFAGQDYYPSGGWDDRHGACDSLSLAIEIARITREDSNSINWWHVADLMTGSVVACSDCKQHGGKIHDDSEHKEKTV